jgi:plastocyanin
VPTSVPAGTTFTFTNQGTEAHEMVVVRKNEGVTQTFQELLTLPDQEAFQLVAVVGATVAPPGEQAEAPVTVQDEGGYLMICFIPQGTTDLSEPGGTPRRVAWARVPRPR